MPEPEIGVRSGPLELTVDQQVVAQYAHAADDYNPGHFDDTAARRLRHGRLSLKFVRPVAVGETVTAYAALARAAHPRADGADCARNTCHRGNGDVGCRARWRFESVWLTPASRAETVQ